jgi:hypothetical protein
MEKDMKKFLILLILVLLPQPAFCGTDGKGGQPGAFRDLILGGRPAAMGGAFTAIAEGGAGYFYNPAGAAQSRMYHVSFAYRVMHLDRRLGYAAVGIPAKEDATLAVTWTYAGTSDLEARDEQGYVIPGEEFSHRENLISIIFAKQVIPQIILGGKAFYVQNNIGNINAYTVGIDMGGLVKLDARKTFLGKTFPLFRAGFAVENLGANYRWTTTEFWQGFGREQGTAVTEKFPINYRLGTALSFPNKYLVAADVEVNSVSMLKTRFGGEYNVNRDLMLRAGLDDFHPTFGFGLFKRMEEFAVMIDLSYLFDKAGEGDDVLVSFDVVF